MDWSYHTFLSIFAGLLLLAEAQVNQPPTWVAASVSALTRGVSEATPIGAFLTQLQCIDPEGDPIRYALQSGKAVRVFSNGTVTLGLTLDYEPKDPIGYDLTFTCTDVNPANGLDRHQPVPINTQISVNDANDNAPVFQVDNAEGYSFFVREDEAVGHVVESSIRTVDRDKSVNAVLKTMYFICNSPNATELATLTPSSKEMCDKFRLSYSQEAEGIYQATVTLIAPLDYETRPVYLSKLIAIDGPGVNNVSFTTTVNIQIQLIDTQDVLPLFTNPGASTTVSEGAAVGTVINFGISARDGDTGDRRPIALSIIQDPKNAFNLTNATLVSANDGIYESRLIVRNQLDREQNLGAYEFIVKATEIDKNTSQLVLTATATATYSVFVSDVNDNPPRFSQDVYRINVTEMDADNLNTSVQITGLHIICSDPDEPSNAKYQVKVVSQVLDATGQQIQAYSISPGVDFTGNASMFLKVDQPMYLDYDNPNYRTQTILLRAEEINTQELFTSSTTIYMYLQDINDNAPQFPLQEYDVPISENSPFPQSILTINATDRDSGRNGEVTYRLEGGTSGKFSIDPSTGVLSLIQEVDYETTPEYVFLVYATDRADEPRSTQVQVTVRIQNFNDLGPVFNQILYQTTVNESSLHFLNPINITATDDEAGGQPITYRILNITGSTPLDSFVLDRFTGELTLNRLLNYDDTELEPNGERSGIITLTVEASDNGQPPETNTVQVRVTVIDENNHPPVLTTQVINEQISELAPPGQVVTKINGTDKDGGDNGKISFRIGEGLSDNFFVDPDTGLITVGDSAALDYDVQNFYKLVIIATDGGAPQKSASCTVNVQILDANNKDPAFPQPLYLGNVDENEPINKVVLSATAFDPDTTALLEYSIRMDTITATDSNGNILSSTLSYDYREAFGVNANNGDIYVKSDLNKEKTQEITFELMVTDKNQEFGPGTGSTQITLTISGEAESGIVFDPVNRVFMNEDAPPGYQALTVTARDPNNNAVSNYMKLSGSANFAVSSRSGTISLVTPIDYEQDTSINHIHTIVVRALSDDGSESATITATISIVDVNDNAPVFQRPEYTAEVSELARYPSAVVAIDASDADSKSYGPLHFRIAGGLDSDDFAIFHEPVPGGSRSTRRAQVIVAQGKQLNYNRRQRYDLDLVVSDNEALQASNNRLYGTAKLIINVLDENNNYPTFKESVRNHSVPETAEIGRSIATIIATDADFGLNGEILYSLEPLNEPDSELGLSLFSITPQLGTVTVASSLLGKGNKVYPMIVRARDRGDPSNSATMLLRITVLSTEDDDGNPKWLLPANGYVVYAPEETAPYLIKDSNGRSQFFDVNPRTGDNITFSLSPYGPFASSFQINRITGELTIISPLDREIQETYNLLVYAEDTVDPIKFRSGRQIVVKLTDINDNDATFTNPKGYEDCIAIERPVMTVYVKENTPANTTVDTLRACDADGPNYNRITYSLYSGNTYCATNNGLSGVRLEPDGRLITNRLIDYEQDKEFNMCVQANSVIPATNTTRRKRSFDVDKVDLSLDYVAYINIQILDLNDNGPRFPETSVVGVVQTDPDTGPAITLDASDPDGNGKNTILYRIEDSVFFPQGDGPAQRFVGAFTLRGDKGAIYPALPSYQDFSGGRFELTVVAVDSNDNSYQDVQKITIYVYDKGQSVKLILDLEPDEGFPFGKPLVERLSAVSERYTFVYKQVSVHQSQDGTDPTKTDVCFIAIDAADHYILNIRQVVQLLDQSQYEAIWGKDEYAVLDRGQCYPSQSSEKSIKWRDLWWVLVAVGIFMFICCIILIILISILYSRYKRYMKTRKTYMVAQ